MQHLIVADQEDIPIETIGSAQIANNSPKKVTNSAIAVLQYLIQFNYSPIYYWSKGICTNCNADNQSWQSELFFNVA